jgi:hypothetical protein
MDTRPAHPGIMFVIFVFDLLPLASKSNVAADRAQGAGKAQSKPFGVKVSYVTRFAVQ